MVVKFKDIGLIMNSSLKASDIGLISFLNL